MEKQDRRQKSVAGRFDVGRLRAIEQEADAITSRALMPTDPRGRSNTKEWLFAALNSVEMASLPWVLLQFSGEPNDSSAYKQFDGFLNMRLKHM